MEARTMTAPIELSRAQGDQLKTVPPGFRLFFSMLANAYYLMPRKLLPIILCMLAIVAHSQTCITNAQVTLTGNLRSANGIPSSNSILTLTPSQQGLIAGCGVNLATVNTCATSTDGSVVGIQNPQTATVNTTSGGGSLPSGVYYTVYEWYDAAGHVTLVSPETATSLGATGTLVVNPPSSGVPALAVGMDVFISTSSGTETLQGQTTGTASFVQSTALTSGSSPASTNTTLCQVVANDAVWPTGTGYNVSMVTVNGNPVPNYPMQWQLLGPGSTYNLSNGLPYYHGVVFYPVPILSQPANHGQQSISGPLNMGGYFLLNIGKVGIGTTTPGWPLDVENGLANFQDGLLLGGVAPTVNYCAASSTGVAIDEYVACITSIGTIYYQTFEANGTNQTQRPAANFSQRFTLSDSSSPARTNVDLNAPGTANLVATYGSSPSTSTNCATFDGSGNLIPYSTTCGLGGFTSGNNANGYWVKDPTGTITERGSITVTNGGGTLITGSITFPQVFSTLDSLVLSAGNTPGGSNDAFTVYSTSAGTTGATAVVRCAANIGGSGCASISNTVPIYWIAVGR
jgi:hypothetical protein